VQPVGLSKDGSGFVLDGGETIESLPLHLARVFLYIEGVYLLKFVKTAREW
jgi:hypothetical protein